MNEDIAVCQAIQKRMQNDDIDVICVQSDVKALDLFVKQELCLVILDVRHSAEDRIELLHMMRSTKHTPILALIPHLEKEDKIALFHAGADVCLNKTADIDICVTQADALIQVYLEGGAEWERQEVIAIGTELLINPRCRQVIADGEPLELTRKEFDLLHYLARYQKQVFSRRQLYTQVWHDDTEESGEETVRVHLNTLRKKLLSVNKDLIQNVWGVGYRLVPPQTDL